jgi:putative transposase
MFKAYKYRIYPDEKQTQQFAEHFGCVRWVYNWGLGRKQEHYQATQKNLSARQLQDELVALKKTEEKSWLNQVNSQALLAILLCLNTAFMNFFSKKSGFPRFKKKYDSEQSYQCPQHVTVDFLKEAIKLPKIGAIKAKLHRSFEGTIKTTTIRRTSSGHYYASILVETADVLPTATTVVPEDTLGIDLGINAFLVTSDGQKKPAVKPLFPKLKRIKTLQRRLSKKVPKSRNRSKARKHLARLHEQVKNRRLEAAHQASAELVYKNHATSFALEDLNVKGMLKNHKLARAISDCGWSEFVRQLEYKSAWVGKNVLKIDRWAPSSKQCSRCRHQKDRLSLGERLYDCTACGLKLDRDWNAAINIKWFALSKIGLEWPEFKPVDHALTGAPQCGSLVIHGMKQEAHFI